MTIQTVRQCRSEERFNSVWQILLAMGLKIKRWLTGSQFEFARSQGTQDLVGAKTNAADIGIAPTYEHILCVHRHGAVRA